MTTTARWRLAAMIFAACTAPVSARAQSIVTGSIDGVVTDSVRRPISGVLVTLRSTGAGAGRSVQTSSEGKFALTFVIPGTYQLVAEALGRRPVLAERVRVDAGRTTSLQLTLAAAQPPVERRDTVSHAGAPDAARGTLGWVERRVLEALPADRPELRGLLSLDGAIDAAAGLEGLPGRLTTLYVDGLPFRAAHHPASAADPAGGLGVPRAAVAAVALPRGSDIEWNTGSGDAVAVSTGVRREVPEVFGVWGGDAGWKSAGFPGTPPPFQSLWAGGAATLALVPDTALVHIALDGGRWHRPLAALVADSIAAALGEEAAALALPQLAKSEWTTGSARLQWGLRSGGALQATLSGSRRTHDAPTSPSPALRYLAPPVDLEATDLIGGASLTQPITGLIALDVRAGGSMSRRRFGRATAVPANATFLLDPSVAFDGPVDDLGLVRRSDVGGTVAVHAATGVHRAKLGIRAGIASHRYELLGQARGTFVFADPAQIGGAGLFTERSGGVAPVSFSVPSAEAFLQYRWAASSGLSLTVGGRYGIMMLPADDVRFDLKWGQLTGLFNRLVPPNARYGGGIVHATWDPSGSGRTVLEAGMSLEHGETDPAALYELIQNSGQQTVRRVVGELAQWPAAPATGVGTRLSSLTLIDPLLAPPRTNRVVVGFAHRFGAGATLRVEGASRLTEFLLRRSDLNVPIAPALTGEGGRRVLAPLASWGGVVGPASPGAWRRFGEYDAVWALNGDGWSRYRGLSMGLDQPFARGGVVFASYTFSETTDNLVGLAAGDQRAALSPGIDEAGTSPWAEGRSDLDIPHRIAAGLTLPVPTALIGYLSAVYRGRSGSPFTPMVRRGLDVNGDGSWSNDVAWIPADEEVPNLALQAGCVSVPIDGFPERNSCRGAMMHELDLRLTLGPARVGRTEIELTADLINATDQEDGVRDDALLLLDPSRPISVSAGRVTIPYVPNPGFGSLIARTDRGRQLRLGVRIGGPR